METITLIQPLSTPPHQQLSVETPTPSNEENQENQENGGIEVMSFGLDYEKCREQRIKENKERLEKMGIIDLSLKLKTSIASSRRSFLSERKSKTPLKSLSLGPTLPPRRSSRLQNTTPVTYTEPKEEKPKRGSREIVLEVGAQPELYTEEHEKLLGSTELPWTFYVDGYGPDGRIYDPVNGKTCHQCRQKTLGLRTHCSKCQIVQGQFCGDCLYARYGEHVVEASQNPNWVCPPCRGICNCSLCRLAKGWPPTGSLAKQVRSLGYRSVAHFLIATKRAPTSIDKSAETPQSVKRSIPFKDIDVQGDDESGDDLKSEKKTKSQKEKATSVDEKNGGSRKRTKKEKPEELISENKENNKEEVDTVDDPKMSKKKVGRPPKRTKKENEAEELISENKEEVDTVDDPKMSKKKAGRPPKRTKKENEAEELISENKEEVDTVNDPKMSKKKVGRPPKRTKKENEAEELISENKEVDTVDDQKMSKKKVGRPPKRTRKENEAEELISENKEEVDTVDDPKMSKKRAGRPAKRTKKENEAEELISENKEENNKEEVDTVDDPKMSKKKAGRPPKSTKKENEAKSSIEGSSASAPDSIAKRLRSRSRI